jgi:hypothetical protein
MTNDNDTITTAMGAAAVGVGLLGILSPRIFRGVYGVSDDSGEATYLTRLFSSRNLVLGGLALAASSGEDRKRIATAMIALNTTDALVGLTTTGSGVSGRTRLLGPLTSSAFALGAARVVRGA